MMIGSKRRPSEPIFIGTVEWRSSFIWFPTKCIVDERYIWLETAWQYRVMSANGWSRWETIAPEDMDTLIRNNRIVFVWETNGWKVLPDAYGHTSPIINVIKRVCYRIG